MGTEARYKISADDATGRAIKSAQAGFRSLDKSVLALNKAMRLGGAILGGGLLLRQLTQMNANFQSLATDAEKFRTAVGADTVNNVAKLAERSQGLADRWRVLQIKAAGFLETVLKTIEKMGSGPPAGYEGGWGAYSRSTPGQKGDGKSEVGFQEFKKRMDAELELSRRRAADAKNGEVTAKALVKHEQDRLALIKASVEASWGFNRALREQEEIFLRISKPGAGMPEFVEHVKAMRPAGEASVVQFEKMASSARIFVDELSYGFGNAMYQMISGSQSAADAFKNIWKQAIASVLADLAAMAAREALFKLFPGLGPLLGIVADKGAPSVGALSGGGSSKMGGGSTTYISTVVPPSVTSLLSAGYTLERASAQRARFAAA